MPSVPPLARRLLLPLWVLLLSIPVVAAFALTALLAAWATSALRGPDVPVMRALTLGTLCGLVAWLFIAVFHVRREALRLVFHDEKSFRERIQAELEELGYRAHGPDCDTTEYRPDFTSWVVGGPILARWRQGSVTLTGPRLFLEVLRRRLRVHKHLSGVQQTVIDSWVRQGRHLLKRVEVRLRVPPEHWHAVYRDVVEVLAQDGARVVCEVNILAHTAQGIVKNTVDVVIRDRLRQLGLEADIHEETLARSDADLRMPTA